MKQLEMNVGQQQLDDMQEPAASVMRMSARYGGDWRRQTVQCSKRHDCNFVVGALWRTARASVMTEYQEAGFLFLICIFLCGGCSHCVASTSDGRTRWVPRQRSTELTST